jgi:hypothetical protein
MEYLDGGELFDRVANEGRKNYLFLWKTLGAQKKLLENHISIQDFTKQI